jgi:hypothetical protein
MSHFPSDRASSISATTQFGRNTIRVNEPGGLNMTEINMDAEDNTENPATNATLVELSDHATTVAVQPDSSFVCDVEPASMRNDGRQISRLLAVVRVYLARSGWVVLSFVITTASGVFTGLRSFDHLAGGSLVRSAIVLGALCCLAAVTRGVSNTIEKTLDDKEAVLCRSLLRKGVVGPRRRWATWVSGLSTACVVAYLLNEHRPATPTLADLLPARVFDVVVAVLGVSLITPYVYDLAVGQRQRLLPWSRAVSVDRPIRDDDDVMGALSRMSPPLLVAMFLVLAMFVATYAVGVYEPIKLLGGLGVIGLFTAGLLAAPALLLVQGTAIEPTWRVRFFDAQRQAVASLRGLVVYAHRIIVVTQVVWLGVTLGAITAGSRRAALPHVLSGGVIVAVIVGFVLARILWQWDPNPEDNEPIYTSVLASREHKLIRLAGWALAFGGVCSLVAVLIS